MSSKTILNILSMIFAGLSAFGQDPLPQYHPVSTILVADETPKAINIGVNYSNQPQVQAIASLNEFLFVYGTLNMKNRQSTVTSALGSEKDQLWEQYGYSLGIGTQALGGSGFLNHIEIVAAFQSQNIYLTENFISTPDIKRSLDETLNYFSTQVNFIHAADRWDFGATIQGAYLLFQKVDLENQSLSLEGETAFILHGSLQSNYRLIPGQNLLLHLQLGYDLTLNDIEFIEESENSVKSTQLSTRSTYLKLGIHYRFRSER